METDLVAFRTIGLYHHETQIAERSTTKGSESPTSQKTKATIINFLNG